MVRYEKLVVTATLAKSWMFPEVKNWPETSLDLVKDAVECYEAGAAVVHIHLPPGEEKKVVQRIREQCDVIIQAGRSSDSIQQRLGSFKAKPDMITVNLNHHNINFVQLV